MMSLMRLELALISSIVETTWLTTSPPLAAAPEAEEASWLAVRAESAVCFTVPVSCTSEDAASCRLDAVCSVRLERSWLPEAISTDAVRIESAAVRSWPTIACSASCMWCSERISLEASSTPSTGFIARDRSPSAMASASASASASGVQMVCMFSSVSGTTTIAANTSTRPKVQSTPPWVFSMPARMSSACACMRFSTSSSCFSASATWSLAGPSSRSATAAWS